MYIECAKLTRANALRALTELAFPEKLAEYAASMGAGTAWSESVEGWLTDLGEREAPHMLQAFSGEERDRIATYDNLLALYCEHQDDPYAEVANPPLHWPDLVQEARCLYEFIRTTSPDYYAPDTESTPARLRAQPLFKTLEESLLSGRPLQLTAVNTDSDGGIGVSFVRRLVALLYCRESPPHGVTPVSANSIRLLAWDALSAAIANCSSGSDTKMG